MTNIKPSSLDPVNQTSQGDADQTQATLDFKDDNLIIHCVAEQLPQFFDDQDWLIRQVTNLEPSKPKHKMAKLQYTYITLDDH